ncbi:hypothetical protein [Paenibacillus campi]|uniref:hypothetical protein n=1 Tax=Paenibacillus campi TaxID=3106031 RepID=UPI002AFE9185|nr:hypothetical protein [Paenibacillus sp. SGZ-1014]
MTINARTDLLCVPMRVDAMMVGKSPASPIFANIPDAYDRLAAHPLGMYVPSGLMNMKETEKPGVHISWLLPEGLRQGFQADQTQEPEYPRVPERWTVTRIWCSQQEPDRIQCKHWIVESDALESVCDNHLHNEDSLTFPWLDDPNVPYRILGRSYPFGSDVQEPQTRLNELSAKGPGNPAFSAMYPYHVNVFGFYDQLLDDDRKRLCHVSLQYTVRGYYRDGLPLIQTADDCLERYGWTAPARLQYPASLVLHGGITNLPWVDDTTDYNSPVIERLKQPQLAFGNTSVEAVAALYGQHEQNDERLMHVLFNGQSQRLLNLNGMYQTDYAEHERRFQIASEQTRYILRSQLENDTYETAPSLTVAEQTRFRALQSGLEQWYHQQFAHAAKQSSIYDLWYKYMLKAYQPMKDAVAKKNITQWMSTYKAQMETAMSELDSMEQQLQALQQELDIAAEQLSRSIEDRYKLEKTAGSRYYEPNAPALLLAGAGRGTWIHGASTTTEAPALVCRLLSETVAALQFEFTLRNKAHTVLLETSDLLTDEQQSGLYAELLMESLWFSGLFVDRIVTVIGRKLELLPFTAAERKQLSEIVQHIQQQGTYRTANDHQKLPDAICMHEWKAPWNPVLLCWKGIYYPDPDLISATPQLHNWTFNETDYVFSGAAVDTRNPVILEGRIYLTPYVAQLMQTMAVKQFGDQLPRHLQRLNLADYLSQVLDGFNAAFLMNGLDLTFPIFVMNKGSSELAQQVAAALNGHTMEQPRFGSFFSPLRGGFFKLDTLKLIDTFGQSQQIECTHYAVSEDMRRYAHEVVDQYIMLPPRFMQPTRLDFHWLQARSDEYCDFSLADSPICGWMIPNHTDQSLLIYDEQGIMLGSLVTTAFAGRDVQWRNAPGISQQPGVRVEADQVVSDDMPARMNPDMRAFLTEMLRRSEQEQQDVLTPFLEIVDSAMWDMDQQQSADASGLSLFVGKPLILAKATIQLVQAGPPAQYKSNPGGSPQHLQPASQSNDISIQQFQMPLWIGEERHTGDGAVGFFVLDGEHDYTRFNSAFIQGMPQSDYLQPNYRLDLAVDAGAACTKIAVILDPMEAIHLRSGMLPVSEQRIPPDRIESGMEQLYLTLYTGPLLVGEGGWLMPFTRLPERDWTFVTPGDEDVWLEIESLQPANGNAFLAKPPFRAVEGWLKLKAGGTHESKS